MSETETYNDIKSDALASLSDGDALEAFQKFRRVLCYGTEYLVSSEDFGDAFHVFGQISETIAGDEFAMLSHEVASNPNDVQSLYDLGYGLYEQSLFSVAALVLDRANRLVPHQPAIVSELVCSLEAENLCQTAVEVLSENEELTQSQFLFAYLMAFNQFMSGNLIAAGNWLQTMSQLAEDDDHEVMRSRVQSFVDRAEQIQVHSALDSSDLRGWHYAINGSLLLELSPYGYPEPMSGRFAYLSESYESCLRGIQLLKSYLDGISYSPQTVFSLADRNSQILASAVSKSFGCELKIWPEAGTDEPGVIVAYNLSEAELSEPLSFNRSGQLLYSHVLTWTESCPIAPDIVYHLAQTTVEPWGSQMRIDPETQELEQTEPDSREPKLVAENILSAELTKDEAELAEDEEVPPPLSSEFVSALSDLALRTGGREKYWVNSPVQSARFA